MMEIQTINIDSKAKELLELKEKLKNELSLLMSELKWNSKYLMWKTNGLHCKKRDRWEALQEANKENENSYWTHKNDILAINLKHEIEYQRETLKEYESQQKQRKIKCKEVDRELSKVRRKLKEMGIENEL